MALRTHTNSAEAFAFFDYSILLESDDGGVYARSQPTSTAGFWVAFNATLRTPCGIRWRTDSKNDVLPAPRPGHGTRRANRHGDTWWQNIQRPPMPFPRGSVL